MTEIFESTEDTTPVSLGHRLGKMLVATAVTFVATALAEKAYDSFVARHNHSA